MWENVLYTLEMTQKANKVLYPHLIRMQTEILMGENIPSFIDIRYWFCITLQTKEQIIYPLHFCGQWS